MSAAARSTRSRAWARAASTAATRAASARASSGLELAAWSRRASASTAARSVRSSRRRSSSSSRARAVSSSGLEAARSASTRAAPSSRDAVLQGGDALGGGALVAGRGRLGALAGGALGARPGARPRGGRRARASRRLLELAHRLAAALGGALGLLAAAALVGDLAAVGRGGGGSGAGGLPRSAGRGRSTIAPRPASSANDDAAGAEHLGRDRVGGAPVAPVGRRLRGGVVGAGQRGEAVRALAVVDEQHRRRSGVRAGVSAIARRCAGEPSPGWRRRARRTRRRSVGVRARWYGARRSARGAPASRTASGAACGVE